MAFMGDTLNPPTRGCSLPHDRLERGRLVGRGLGAVGAGQQLAADRLALPPTLERQLGQHQ
jgi:hypothetical protein